MTLAERIDEIDKMLFEAGVLVLSGRKQDADRKITDARVQLDKLRARVE